MGVIVPFADRRKDPRTDVGNRLAHMDLRDGSAPISVCVWDISRGGVCLVIPPDMPVPDAFDLILDGSGYPVKRIWRREIFVGVSYCLMPEPPAAA